MLTVGGVAILFAFVYWRPQEFIEDLPAQILGIVVLLASFTLLIDHRVGAVRMRSSPLLVLLLSFATWGILSVVIKAPDTLYAQLSTFGIVTIAFVILSEGLQNLRAFTAFATVFLCFSLAMAALGLTQGLAPKVCYVMGTAVTPRQGVFRDLRDGRPCETVVECRNGGVAGADYLCEHPGALETHSIQGRVRYRGILEDPNEMSWALNMGMPFAFAIYERKKSALRLLAVVAMVALGGICVVMTASRSGQFGLLATLGVYFLRRFRWGGAVLIGVLSIPLLLLGGRSGAEAEASTDDRMEAWSQALTMWRENPLTGVGAGQFTSHHYLTAHNSFMLSLAELGPLGFFLWTATIYFAFKITVRAQVHLAGDPAGAVARSWATALFASMVGTVISATLLSLTYHPILWIFIGLIGALYGAIRAHDPEFRVFFGWRDFAAVSIGDIGIVAATALYLRMKGF
jgi:O-antigen ligase